MKHPYQCLALCRPAGSEARAVLLTACGPQIFAYDIENGKVLSTWPQNQKDDEDVKDSSPEIITTSKNGDEPARKRRKTVKPKSNAGSFTKLITSHDGHHVVATTGEEKSVLVFHIGEQGQIDILSQRHMLKRPCAIAFTPENNYILVGDKFGDVYALPLHPSEKEALPIENGGNSDTKPALPPFKPSATNLTVHTARNRRALEDQMKKRGIQEAKPKESMDFEHELLLGHVSMLTDIATVSVQTTNTDIDGSVEKLRRSYILSSDRDEHIRVSRGQPQAWIIENYCFGHTQFVSKLCIPHQDILVSGGGDDHLFVWDWCSGALLGKLDLQKAVAEYWESQPVRMRRSKKDIIQKANDEASVLQDSREAEGLAEASHDPEELQAEDTLEDRVAISGLWGITDEKSTNPENPTINIFCACEGIPAIFSFNIPSAMRPFDGGNVAVRIFPLAGNALDMVFHSGKLLISVDNVHEPASTKDVRHTIVDVPRFQTFDFDTVPGAVENEYRSLQDAVNGNEQFGISAEGEEAKNLRDLLYGVENLRKRGNEEP